MNISFYTGASGMIAQQEGMNIYSNNIANVNTVGYKSLRPSFADCLYQVYRRTEPEWQTGHGQFVMKTDFMWEQGGFVLSEQGLDFAIAGESFFMVRDERGNTYLTRDGAFNMTQIDDHWELVNARGEFVLDNDGNHITIPFRTAASTNVKEDETGNGTIPDAAGREDINTVRDDSVVTTEVDYEALTDMIGLFGVPNNWGLNQGEDNHFVVTPRSGDPVPVTEQERKLLNGALELSTVDLAAEMVHLIETQRSYQLSSRVVTTSDELMNIANTLR
ncbi:MAG: flagellar hook-basal body protein [Ruminiclostridium sp.]|nr:flagellar hook-basal body protein [Ruminiclostridium sp.]